MLWLDPSDAFCVRYEGFSFSACLAAEKKMRSVPRSDIQPLDDSAWQVNNC